MAQMLGTGNDRSGNVNKRITHVGSGCGSVERDSDIWDLQFESSHRHNFLQAMFLLLTDLKTKIKKRDRERPIFKRITHVDSFDDDIKQMYPFL